MNKFIIILAILLSSCVTNRRWVKIGQKNRWIDTTAISVIVYDTLKVDTLKNEYQDSVIYELNKIVDEYLKNKNRRDTVYNAVHDTVYNRKIKTLFRTTFVERYNEKPCFKDTLTLTSANGEIVKIWISKDKVLFCKVQYKKQIIKQEPKKEKSYFMWYLVIIILILSYLIISKLTK